MVLVVGMEKMYFEDRSKFLPAFMGGMDVEFLAQYQNTFEAFWCLIFKTRFPDYPVVPV